MTKCLEVDMLLKHQSLRYLVETNLIIYKSVGKTRICALSWKTFTEKDFSSYPLACELNMWAMMPIKLACQ